jgi:MarR family multiple antibiotic resistance transcriptional regulator
VATNRANDEVLRFFDDLVRCETRLYNALGEVLREEHGLATSQYEFLRYLRDHPGSRIADIAANFAAGVGAVSKGVGRLEAKGWTLRHPNPADARSSLVTLTPAGERLAADAEGTFRERLADLVSSTIDPSGPGSPADALSTLRRSLEQGRIGLPIG